MGYIPPQPDPELEGEYGRRLPKDYAYSVGFGVLGMIVFVALLAVAVRLAS